MRHVQIIIVDDDFKNSIELNNDGPGWTSWHAIRHEGQTNAFRIATKSHFAYFIFRLWRSDALSEAVSAIIDEVDRAWK